MRIDLLKYKDKIDFYFIKLLPLWIKVQFLEWRQQKKHHYPNLIKHWMDHLEESNYKIYNMKMLEC
jgi:hypothetical protein